MDIVRRRFILGSAALGIPGALQGINAASAQDAPISIGGFGPLSGPASWIGLGCRDGLALAVDEINGNGGIDGRKIVLTFEAATTPADSIAAVKKLVEVDKVAALVVGSGSTGAAAAADYLREAGVPAYNVVGATPKIREPFARNIFHGVFPHAKTIAHNFAKEALRSAPGSVAVLVGSYELPQALWAGVKPQVEAAKSTVATVQSFELGAKDFTAQLLAANRSKADAILFFGHFTEAALALKQAGSLGMPGSKWFLDISAVSDAVPSAAGQAAEGARSIWMFPYYFGADKKPMQDFEAKWRRKYGTPGQGRPNYVDVTGYGDMYVLATAFKRAGKSASRDDLVSAFEGMRDTSPSSFAPFASDVIFPETFSTSDHDGNARYAPIAIKDGRWQVIG